LSTAEQTFKQVSVKKLKELFAQHLREADRLKRPEGLPTGLQALDRFLFWGGLPKGALSLLCGSLGTGVTSLWLETAARGVNDAQNQPKNWVAWVNCDIPLSPLSLHHKGLSLERFVSIEPPANEAKLFWLLQELMSSSLFELIGCDLGSFRLKEHQIRKLQAQAREAHVALVFLSPKLRVYRGSAASVFSLIINFEQRRILIERALHRPTPHSFARSVNYARFTHHTGDRIGFGSQQLSTSDSADSEPSPLPETSRAAFCGV
jgi:recombination protein RecA